MSREAEGLCIFSSCPVRRESHCLVEPSMFTVSRPLIAEQL
jgi:hypothetical protein